MKTKDEVILEIKDTDLRILTNDASNDPPSNGPDEGNFGVLFPVVNGIPQLSSLSKLALTQLQEQLQQAVINENYELAAKIRDEISKRF